MHVTVLNTFAGMCAFLEYVWVGATVENIYRWVYLFRIHLWMGVGVCDCLKHIYDRVYLSKRHLWMTLTV